jgi:hypothetical protein
MLDAIYDIALGMLLNDATSKKLGKKKNHWFPSSCQNIRGF